MSDFHKNFPFGKGVWIWKLQDCLGGNISAIIQKLKEKDIQYVLVKSGDGVNAWDSQWTKDLIDQFHAAGIKIYSWSFIYGIDPLREAQIASWSLNLGGDGHVFDAETQYEQLPNPSATAEKMLQALRVLNPNDFVAHSPLPIIDYHLKFPYAIFGKYCDAIMPQVYQGDFRKSSLDAINWMYEQWSKWEISVAAESRKPIIPVAQAYDNYEMSPVYTLTPKDIQEFVAGSAGYKSVNFYEFAHILREDCWEAIRIAKVTPPTDQDLGRDNSSNQAQPQNSTNTPTPLIIEAGKQYTEEVLPSNLFNITDGDRVYFNGQNYNGHINENGTRSFTLYVEPAINQVSDKVDPISDKLSKDTDVIAQRPLPVPSTIKVTKNPQSPGGVQLKVVPHKPHIDYMIEFFSWIFSQISAPFKKGGESK